MTLWSRIMKKLLYGNMRTKCELKATPKNRGGLEKKIFVISVVHKIWGNLPKFQAHSVCSFDITFRWTWCGHKVPHPMANRVKRRKVVYKNVQEDGCAFQEPKFSYHILKKQFSQRRNKIKILVCIILNS